MGSSEHDDARPRPDPLDRTWIHPSEARSAPRPAPKRRRDWGLALGAGLLASAATLGVLAVAGVLGGDSEPASSARPASTTAPVASAFAKVSAIAESAGPAVVAIAINGAKTRCASGVAMAGAGHVVTSRSATLGAASITVIDSRGGHHAARLIGTDPATDLAVLQVDSLDAAAPLGSTTNLRKGAMVVALGAANEVDHWHVAGIVDDLTAAGRGRDGTLIPGLIATDADIAPTAAGGALVDARGRVIGILLRTAPSADGGPAAYALPIETASSIANRLASDGKVVHSWIGIAAVDADPGARVDSVTPGGPAAAAGLQPGDVVVAAGGAVLADAADLATTVARRQPGSDLALTVRRGETRFMTRVLLAPAPDPSAGAVPTATGTPVSAAAGGR